MTNPSNIKICNVKKQKSNQRVYKIHKKTNIFVYVSYPWYTAVYIIQFNF